MALMAPVRTECVQPNSLLLYFFDFSISSKLPLLNQYFIKTK